jgi:uncharacterized membrane protein YkoI
MRPAALDELLRLWQDGEASAGELRELESLLRSDPAHRRALVGSVLIEVDLYGRYAKSTGQEKAARSTSFPPVRKMRRLEALAAVLIVGISAFAIGRLLQVPETPSHRVVAGEVWAGGAAVGSVPEGEAFEVRGEAPASLRLKDGSEAVLLPGSAGAIRGGARPAFELARGSATFTVGPFRVETPTASISTGGGEFSVGLGKEKPPSLGVSVTTGVVRVDYAGAQCFLGAGESCAFKALVGPAAAGPPDAQKLVDAAAFSLAEAVDKALAAAPGVAVSVVLENDDGRIAFSVVLAGEGDVREIGLDAKTGAVFEDETENRDASEVVAAAKIPLGAAIRKALARVPGRAVEAELERRGGRALAEVEILSDGTILEVTVDAVTGATVEVGRDGTEGER